VINLTMAAIDHGQPPDVEPVGANATRAGADHRAPLRGIDGIGDNQPRIVPPRNRNIRTRYRMAASARLPTGWCG